jgi:hypothetical protein
MIVVLDDTLKIGEVTEKMKDWSKKSVINDLFRKSKGKGYNKQIDVALEDASTHGEPMFHTLGFVGLLSEAYSAHLPVVVAPHDFWFIANTELAAIVAKNPEQFRHVFTASESGKETLMIPTGDVTRIDYRALTELLDEKIPSKRIHELMLPELTTIDASVFYALCATLADTCQHYYDYMTMMCGIPKIKVRGEESDYRLLAAASRELAKILSFSTEAFGYYDRIAGLFDRMADTFVRGPEESAEFWRAIYTQKNVGSGRQLDIDGWIRDFFSKRPRRLESFHTSIAAVLYQNLETQNEYLSLVGAFTAFQDSEGFWRVNFQEAVFQKVDKKDETPVETRTSFNRVTGEQTIHYSDGSKKVEKIDQPLNKDQEIGKKAAAVPQWTIQELPSVAVGFQQVRGVEIDDSLDAAVAFAMEAIMVKEDNGSK